jgi:hypothetical protein
MDADNPAECRDSPGEHEADAFSADDWNRRLAVLRQSQSYARTSGREARRRPVQGQLADREENGRGERTHPRALELYELSPPPGRRRAAWGTTSDVAGS